MNLRVLFYLCLIVPVCVVSRKAKEKYNRHTATKVNSSPAIIDDSEKTSPREKAQEEKVKKETTTVDVSSGNSSFTPCRCEAKSGCRCVQFYLCIGGTITKSGFGILRKRAAADSCPLETEICCPESWSGVHEEAVQKPVVVSQESCGTRRRQRGGGSSSGWHASSHTYFGEFPWTVLILRMDNDKPLCSGALVNKSVVVTAAHCVDEVDVSHLKVVAGDWDYDSTVEPLPPIQRLVKAKLVHDDYDDATLAHDVAVLLLNQPLPASVTVDIVCLPQQNSYSFLNNRCLSTGWGKDEYSRDETRIKTMKKITWGTVQASQESCGDMVRGTELEDIFRPRNGQICAKAKPQGQICQNDVGSPLVCPDEVNRGRYVLAGLAYGNVQCGGRETKELFVNVPEHSLWIKEKILYLNFPGL